MTVFFMLAAVLFGAGISAQGAINSKLSEYVHSPYLSSCISFCMGAVLLTAALLISPYPFLIPAETFRSEPWWIWVGGALGVIMLTSIITIFPKIGAVEAAVLPIFGQLITGVLIDQFGIAGALQTDITVQKILSILIVILGVLMATGSFRKREQTGSSSHKTLWRALGILAGMVGSLQTAINGYLGTVLDSALHAAAISFTVGAAVLLILLAVLRIPLSNTRDAVAAGKKYWWIWIGGFLGSCFVFGNAWLAPIIGTGQVVVYSLVGQLICSAVIDHYGLFESSRNRIDTVKFVGLLLVLIGSVLFQIL